MAGQRLHYFDNVKAVLILLVVVGHVIDISVVGMHKTAQAAFVFIYSFHMPLFIFLSGLFVDVGRMDVQKVVRRIFYFIVLGYTAKVVYQIVPVLSGGQFSFSLLSDGGIPWYLFAMAAFYTLAFFLRKVNQFIVLAFSILLGLFVGYDSNVGDYLYLSRIAVFFLSFGSV